MTDIGVKIKINIILPNDSDSWKNNETRNQDLLHIDILSFIVSYHFIYDT